MSNKNKPARVPVDEPVETMRMVGVVRVAGGYRAVVVDVPIDIEAVSVSPVQPIGIALALADQSMQDSVRR